MNTFEKDWGDYMSGAITKNEYFERRGMEPLREEDQITEIHGTLHLDATDPSGIIRVSGHLHIE